MSGAGRRERGSGARHVRAVPRTAGSAGRGSYRPARSLRREGQIGLFFAPDASCCARLYLPYSTTSSDLSCQAFQVARLLEIPTRPPRPPSSLSGGHRVCEAMQLSSHVSTSHSPAVGRGFFHLSSLLGGVASHILPSRRLPQLGDGRLLRRHGRGGGGLVLFRVVEECLLVPPVRGGQRT